MSWQPKDDDDEENEGSEERKAQAEANAEAAEARITKQRDKAVKEAAELKERLAALEKERRDEKVASVIKNLGGEEVWADFVPGDLEPSEDAVRSFLEGKKLLSPGEQQDQAEARGAAAPASTFVASPPGATAPSGTQKISEDDLDKLMMTDPQRAMELANKGLVEWSEEVLRLSS